MSHLLIDRLPLRQFRRPMRRRIGRPAAHPLRPHDLSAIHGHAPRGHGERPGSGARNSAATRPSRTCSPTMSRPSRHPAPVLPVGACGATRVAFEFLDNTVPNGEVPRTIAFGGNDAMIVLDPVALLDIERFRKINRLCGDARAGLRGHRPCAGPQRRVPEGLPRPARRGAVRRARHGARVYARFERGRLVARDRTTLDRLCTDAAMRATCEASDCSTGGPEDETAPAGPPVTAELTLRSGGCAPGPISPRVAMHNLHARDWYFALGIQRGGFYIGATAAQHSPGTTMLATALAAFVLFAPCSACSSSTSPTS